MGMKGWCQSLTAPAATLKMMENMMPHLYKDPQTGPCPVVTGNTVHCKNENGMKTCISEPKSPWGSNEDTVEFLHNQATEAMWGDVRYVHIFMVKKGHTLCVQVDGKGIRDHKNEKKAEAWVAKHLNEKIHDGKCGAKYPNMVYKTIKGGDKIHVFM